MFEAGYRAEAEHRKATRFAYQARLNAAGLQPLEDQHYSEGNPSSEPAWELHKKLLQTEGNLTALASDQIEAGMQGVRLREVENLVGQELKSGGEIPHPFNARMPNITAKYALSSSGETLVRWESIRRLGWAESPRYSGQKSSAARAIQLWEYQQIDQKAFWQSVQHRPEIASSDNQQAEIPEGFVEIQIVIPKTSIKSATTKFANIRYHPQYGLVVGKIVKKKYFDKGAGGFMSGRGAFVINYTPVVELLVPLVNSRAVTPKVRMVSGWCLTVDSNVAIGRARSGAVALRALGCSDNFASAAEAQGYFSGVLESHFLGETFPVKIVGRRESYELSFWARRMDVKSTL